MKTLHKYLPLVVLLMIGLLANCHKDDDVASSAVRPADAVKLSFAASSKHTHLTRSNPVDAQKETAFNVGDGVSVSVPGQNPVTYVLGNDGYWTENPTTDYLLWKSNTQTFSAYYPVTERTSMTHFTLPTDQTTEAKIALADYMTAKKDIDRPADNNTAISLELQRRTARVIVEIKKFNNQYTDEQKYISSLEIWSGADEYDNGVIWSSTPPRTLIAPYVQGKVDGKMTEGTTFTALVFPTETKPENNFIFVSDYENHVLVITGIPAMEAGKSYKYSLIIGKNKIEIGSVTVEDWDGTPTAIDGKAYPTVSSVAINAPTFIKVGSTGMLNETVAPDDAIDKTVTWSSSDPDVLSINATTGEYKAKAVGSATITATSGTVSATCDVSVVAVTLANAFEDGAEITIKGKIGNTLNELFKNENGTFTQQSTNLGNNIFCTELSTSGNNLVLVYKDSMDRTYTTIIFNSYDNTYSISGQGGYTTVSDLSISINGNDITFQLTQTN